MVRGLEADGGGEEGEEEARQGGGALEQQQAADEHRDEGEELELVSYDQGQQELAQLLELLFPPRRSVYFRLGRVRVRVQVGEQVQAVVQDAPI